jgi:hypothetical protein
VIGGTNLQAQHHPYSTGGGLIHYPPPPPPLYAHMYVHTTQHNPKLCVLYIHANRMPCNQLVQQVGRIANVNSN